jgi:uncharacterized phage protein gp47/JayE
MPFARPTLPTLIERVIADIETRLPGTDARLRRSNLNVLARVHGGGAHGLYGYLDFIARQVIIDTAEAEYLERWASIWSIVRTPAAAAAGSVTFTGADGSIIPMGTLVLRSDGAEVKTTAEVAIAGGTATVAATAAVAGVASNTNAASALTLASPIAGVNGNAVVAAGGLVGGADVEDDQRLLARLLARIQQPPHGGAGFDYIAWAKEISGVTRAWVYPGELGAGTVTVRFVRDEDPSAIPDAGEVAAVQAHIDAVRPVTAQVTVAAPIAQPQNFTIALTPDTPAGRAAVEAELRDLILREAEPGGTVLLSHIREAVSVAVGETDHNMTVPAANVAAASVAHMITFGAITWL